MTGWSSPGPSTTPVSYTHLVSEDVSQRDVKKILQKVAALDDIREVKAVCGEIVGQLERRDKEGFSKNLYRCYGEDMRMIAKGIVRDIHAANGRMFAIEHEERLRLIGPVSYTHLDVYKRQATASPGRRGPPAAQQAQSPQANLAAAQAAPVLEQEAAQAPVHLESPGLAAPHSTTPQAALG